ncbi:MAG: AAA family ATPase, partial [Firmicutes bacterium]|nr:AAA family ATPase [Bacillota bacterium]
MDLFEYARQSKMEKEAPLAARLRPETLEDFVGQEHIIGKNTLLYRSIKADKLSSIILYGPPGTGKTTLAHVIAHTTKGEFCQINATTAGKKDITDIVEKAKNTIVTSGKRTILFIDEIHRFNKAQQDALLPYVEDGTLILIGATTENPYFEVNKALVSRSIIFELKEYNTTVTLSKDMFAYNGKVQKPKVNSVVYNGKKLKANTDYAVKYWTPDSTDAPWEYNIEIIGKNNYRSEGFYVDYYITDMMPVNSLTISGIKDQVYTGSP